MESVRTDAIIMSTLHSMLEPTAYNNATQGIEALKQELYAGPNNRISEFFKQINNDLDGMLMLPPQAKPLRGRKKKKQESHPNAIPEENEDGDVVVVPFVPSHSTDNSEDSTLGAVAQDTTVSSTSNRPRRAAVAAAEEKIKRMTEVSLSRKMRRPSDFNQNDHGNYNVYNLNQTNTNGNQDSHEMSSSIQPEKTHIIVNQTHTNVNQTHTIANQTHTIGKVEGKDECFPRTKRRKGSDANNSVITSSHFFSSTMIHSSSPIQKNLPGLDSGKGLEVSMIPPHSESVMEVEEVSIHRTTRTRTRRLKKPEESPPVVVKEEIMEVEEEAEEKENAVENGQDICSTDEESAPVRTRTRNVKKTVNRVEDLPVVRASPVKTIGEKIREKVDLFENAAQGVEKTSGGDTRQGGDKTSGGDTSSDVSAEGRVTRTKTRKMNKSAEDEKNKAQAEFKVPLAVKNTKDAKKLAAVKKGTDKAKEMDAKQAALDERKRLREERAQKAALARDLAEKEKREHALRLEREREEKLKLKKVRDEKTKEEMERKRLQTQAKIEQQKREFEAARNARLQEIMEDEARKEAKWKKEQEIAERKVQAAQQAKLAEKLKASKQAVKNAPPLPVEEPNYSISEEPLPSDEDEEAQPKKPIPSWARPMNRNVVLAHQIYLSSLVPAFFENVADFTPSLTNIFGQNVRLRPRTSSAVWNRTVTE